MTKRNARKQSSKNGFYLDDTALVSPTFYDKTKAPPKPSNKPLYAKTEAQGHYLEAIESSEIVFAVGPAGTGKTYIAAAWAAQQIIQKQVDRVILTRPNVETGEEMGHLPGTLEEKYAPYLSPFREIFIERLGKGHYEWCLKTEVILPKPVGFMRGETFNNAVVIVDEAQNLTSEQMKMILTRIGQNCLMVIDGDPDQCDLREGSGLLDALRRVKHIPGVSVVEFTEDDIVRNGIIKDILKSYRN